MLCEIIRLYFNTYLILYVLNYFVLILDLIFIMPLFTREFVSCHAKPYESHLYNDPVMLICSHVFCRSCCLYLAEISHDQSSMFFNLILLIIKKEIFSYLSDMLNSNSI